jgi:hypothetical protein
MAIEITESKFNELDQAEWWTRFREGVVIVPDNLQERQETAASVKAELEAWRRDHAPKEVKLKDFEAMSRPEKDEVLEAIRAGAARLVN